MLLMETPIGRHWRISGPYKLAPAALAVFVAAVDLVLVWSGEYSYLGPRGAIPIVSLALYLILAGGDLTPVGLTVRPLPGLGYWLRTTLGVGVAAGVVIGNALVACRLIGWRFPVQSTSPDQFWSEFIHMCILAPAVEEGTYRIGLCCGTVALLKPEGAIAASGLIFGGLHVLYGNPGPDNLVSGFVLAWAFLKSGSILVPLALHSLGNFCVLVSWVLASYSTA
jgi:uncharacterized protein